MIVLDGLPALSPFRLERLNRELKRAVPPCRLLATWYAYFVGAEENAVAPDPARLSGVLRASTGPAKTATLWVVPRLGTISPWSSKATDILHGCGFAVRRVERAVAYLIDKAPAPDSGDWQRLAAVC
jgi:phosphoribosylformylglycinamidine synthase